MPESLRVPIFSDITQRQFATGKNYLIEFEANSRWFETSLVIAAQAILSGTKTQYHTLAHFREDVKKSLQAHGVSPEKLKDTKLFISVDDHERLIRQPGLKPSGHSFGDQTPEGPSLDEPRFIWEARTRAEDLIKRGATDTEKGWLHVDDDSGQWFKLYNASENHVLHYFETVVVPKIRALEMVAFHAFEVGVHSEAFYKRLEDMCEGIIEFRSEDATEGRKSLVRIRSIRGKTVDSTWKELHLSATGVITLESRTAPKKFGIRNWLKGPN